MTKMMENSLLERLSIKVFGLKKREFRKELQTFFDHIKYLQLKLKEDQIVFKEQQEGVQVNLRCKMGGLGLHCLL